MNCGFLFLHCYFYPENSGLIFIFCIMKKIKDILIKHSSKINSLDLELLIAQAINKPREFVLAHPEYNIPPLKIVSGTRDWKLKIARRIKGEPLSYITGRKEFYRLEFKVDKNTLIPRPETELLVELALKEIQNTSHEIPATKIIDVGTGSGNIIISIANAMESIQYSRLTGKQATSDIQFFATDISTKALRVAKYNARKHKVDKKIKFLNGNLLEPILKNNLACSGQNSRIIILANLPYLSEEIYSAAAPSIRKYEPRSALLSQNHGLAHYEKLLWQIKQTITNNQWPMAKCFFEISPEQKPKISKLIKKYFSETKIEFRKDLAGKWRICAIAI